MNEGIPIYDTSLQKSGDGVNLTCKLFNYINEVNCVIKKFSMIPKNWILNEQY